MSRSSRNNHPQQTKKPKLVKPPTPRLSPPSPIVTPPAPQVPLSTVPVATPSKATSFFKTARAKTIAIVGAVSIGVISLPAGYLLTRHSPGPQIIATEIERNISMYPSCTFYEITFNSEEPLEHARVDLQFPGRVVKWYAERGIPNAKDVRRGFGKMGVEYHPGCKPVLTTPGLNDPRIQKAELGPNNVTVDYDKSPKYLGLNISVGTMKSSVPSAVPVKATAHYDYVDSGTGSQVSKDIDFTITTIQD